MDITYKNKRHEQRVKQAATLSSADLEKILIQRKQEDIAALHARRSELQAELEIIDRKIKGAQDCLTSFGEKPLKNDWETLALQTLKTLVSRERSPQKAADVVRALRVKRPEYDVETLQGYVTNSLRNLANRGIIKKNDQYKTYVCDFN